MLDGCTGIFAKIQTLIYEQPFYRVGDEIVSPVLDILMVVPASAFIKRTCVDTNVVLPMTTEVYIHVCTCVVICVSCHLYIACYPLRNTKIILLLIV